MTKMRQSVEEPASQKLVAQGSSLITPQFGIPCEVAHGVYLLRMPLPFRLDHINLYILDDPLGWTLVDCGLNTPETIGLWENLLHTFLRGKPVARIVVTHLHPDHLGLAQWLHRRTCAPVYMTHGEWEMAQDLFDLPVSDMSHVRAHYQRLGIVGDSLEAIVRQASGYRKLVKELPDGVEYFHGGEVLAIAGRCWRILCGRGHSPQCACLWDEEGRVLIAGDHVLPRISPNINLLSVGSRNPLEDYLVSLGEFGLLPCELLLPAHGLPITHYMERVADLLNHHEQNLLRLESFCAKPCRAADCVELLFGPGLPDHQLYFAIGETAAHLVYLAEQGRLKKVGDIAWIFSRL